MSVSTFDPKNNQINQANSEQDDNIRIMPTSDDLKRPHSEKELIEEALAEAKRPDNLIASSRQQIPNISVNGVVIDPAAIAQEVQYHPANSVCGPHIGRIRLASR